MKKSILQFSVIAAIAASMTLTTSCSSDDSAEEAFVPTPIQLGVDLGKMTVTRGLTRAQSIGTATAGTTIDGGWKEDHRLGIWTEDADGTKKIKVYKVKEDATTTAELVTDAAVGTADADKVFYWKQKGETKVIKAISHGIVADANITKSDNATTIAPLTFTVSSDQTTDFNNEFLYGVGTIKHDGTATGGTKTIPMQHQLTLIEVTVKTKKNANDLALTIGKTGSEIKLGGTFHEPNYTVQSDQDLQSNKYGYWENLTTDGVVTPRCSAIPADDTPSGYKTTFSAVVIPQNFNGNPMFCIHYDGADYVYTGQLTDKLDEKPSEEDNDSTNGINGVGKKLAYTVTITDQEIKVTSATISAWAPVNQPDATAELQ